jgi:hypothetical protein|tara:strand:- start:202 stop:462 length:261 start_codon:yes stop_codon:yes gene_type:complete
MAITKQKTIEEIQVAGEYKQIFVLEVTKILEDGVEISRSNHRTSYLPNEDISSLDPEIVAIANVAWTQAVKDSWQAHLDSIPTPAE